MAPPDRASADRAVRALVAGALLGLALAAWGLLQADGSRGPLPADVVARVNGSLLRREEYQRLLTGLEDDLRQPPSDELRRRVIDRMIDEELLVQRGLELGLVESDRRIRGEITSAMIRSIVSLAEERLPTDEELRAFHREQAAFFTRPGRLRVQQIFLRVRSAEDEAPVARRAARARERLLAGERIEAVRSALGEEEVSPIPDVLLPPAKLREYVGPTALRAVMALEPGGVSEPVRSGIGYHVFLLVDREEEQVPPYEEVAEQVRREWVRREGDRALRDYLDELRDRADLRMVEELP